MRFLAPRTNLSQMPLWPPDAFAITAGVLQKSGGYLRVVDIWPPADGRHATIHEIGRRWREAASAKNRRKVPKVLTHWWSIVNQSLDLPLDTISKSEVAEALLLITIAADEACSGAGFPRATIDGFDGAAGFNLFLRETLCSEAISPSRAVVLPKVHTPQTGMTLRSITHNVALYCPGEVKARWTWMPFLRPEVNIDWNFRMLLLPWPKAIDRKAFRPSPGQLTNMPREYGFFRCDSDTVRVDIEKVKRIFKTAVKETGHIDAIVFPELALRPKEPEKIAKATGALIVGGCGTPPADEKPGRNYASICAPEFEAVHQSKHHRWRLENRQILQYDLGERLDPMMQWWEHIEIGPRELNFVTLADWLVLSFLICEDLARLDPVNQLLHSVGPSLIIALLMDGPQLSSRWGARYATVLADDPGSSVLTLTSIGMSEASRVEGIPPSRVVALWKDAFSGPVEIPLEPGKDGIVLCLRREYRQEFAADGRRDDGNTAYLRLHRQVQVSDPSP